MGFSRQEYWSGLPFPLPGDFPDLGMELVSPALADGFFTAEPPGQPIVWLVNIPKKVKCICIYISLKFPKWCTKLLKVAISRTLELGGGFC